MYLPKVGEQNQPSYDTYSMYTECVNIYHHLYELKQKSDLKVLGELHIL